MDNIEKTVFISYRREGGLPWALLIYKDLDAHDFDAFFDYESIGSGNFEQKIIVNIKSRAHFLVILTPSALDRCNEPEDWLRREIETAISVNRNIVPLFFKGFDFSDPSVSKYLTGSLKKIKSFNGLRVHEDYFDEAMERLRTKFLNKALDGILYPVSEEAQKEVEKRKLAIAQIINRGETKFSGFDVSTFKRISSDTPKSTTENIIDLSKLKTPTCAYCHKPFSFPYAPWRGESVFCDSCNSRYHRSCGHSLLNAQGTHICVNCGQPIDSSKFEYPQV
jgi:hypothetical protein